jgi:hypothetical protein
VRPAGSTRAGVAAVALLLAALAATAAFAAASPAQLAVSVAKSSFRGNQGSQWDALHPRYKAVVSRARFVACERKAAAAVGKITVVNVAALGTQVITAKLPLLGKVDVNDVTLAVTFRRAGSRNALIAQIDSLWVAHKGRWVRIYAPTEYAAYRAGRCP